MADENTTCPYNLADYFNPEAVLHTALFNLSVPCRHSVNESTIYSLDAPSTFLVQLLRLSVAVCIIIAILALYNSIAVLGKTVYSIASCSLHWVVYLIMIMLKSLVLLVLLPVIHSDHNVTHKHTWESLGFILTTLIQLFTTLMLYIALEHERRFRSSDYASIASLFSKDIPTKTKMQLFCNWPRGFAVFFVFISMIILTVLVSFPVSIDYKFNETEKESCNVSNLTNSEKSDAAFGPLMWVWLLSMFKVRMCAVSMVICLLFIKRENFKLTVAAKVYLVLGLLCSVFEDIPNSVVTVIAFKTYILKSSDNVCVGRVFTVYDILQLFGISSLIWLLLFIRSQYLRVEQESKLSMVGDMQRLLQVNGRRDVKSH